MIIYDKILEDDKIYSNAELIALKGTLDPDKAKITFIDFLYNNLGIATQILTGIKLFPFQEIILREWFDHNFSINVWSRGGSKCLDINTLCLTNIGFKRLKDVNVGDDVLSLNGMEKVLAKQHNPISSGLRITSNRGYSIDGILGHKCLIFDPNIFSLSFKTIEELKIGEFIVLKKQANLWNDQNLVENFKYNPGICEKNLVLNNSNDLFYWCGLVMGDGTTRSKQKNKVIITTIDFEIANFLENFYKLILPNSSLYRNKKTSTKAIGYCIHNKSLLKFLTYIGFDIDAKAHEKKFPEKLLFVSKEKISAFLSGLFDTDGYCSLLKNKEKNSQRARIGLTSTSISLLKTIQIVLLNYGILSKIYKCHNGGDYEIMGILCNTQDAFTLSISGFKNIQIFDKEIGFKIKRKSDLVKDYLNNYQWNKKDYQSHIIPRLGEFFIKKYKQKEFKRKNQPKYRFHKNIAIDRIPMIVENRFVDDGDCEKLQFILNNNLAFDKIKEITQIQVETIDIQVDRQECYFGNGFINHNSFLASLFCCLYPLFNPGRKIVLASNVFRSTRRIINQIERIIEAKKAKLLKQCFPLDGTKIKIDRRQDEWCVHINEGFIKALPLNEKIRGERADVLIIDEGLLIPEQIYRDVLLPFLTARTDISKNLELKEVEDALIASGALSEENRILLESDKKIIILSSASYDFQFICKLYNEWVDQITGTNKPQIISKKYFISRLSYKALPNELIDKDITDLAKGGGEQTASFQREFMARFVSDSDGYFNIKKLHANTVIDGDLPCVQIRGNKESKYILAIDPSFSAGLSSDWFAFGLYLLNSDNRSITQVNTYGISGGELNQHLTYLAYLLQNFNIVFLIADLAGENNSFINSANESVVFQERGLKLDFFSGDFEGDNYSEEIIKAQNSYNISLNKICYRQVFSSQWLRIANEHLQAQINYDKIHFASHLTTNDTVLQKVLQQPIPVVIKDTLKNKIMDIVDFIEWQDFLIDETKKELALIEVRATVTGVLQFDLPAALKKLTGVERPRRDLYSCLLMGSWAAKHYFEMMYSVKEPEVISFSPIAIK